MTQCSIPKVLPLSTLACPPSASYIKSFAGGKSELNNSKNNVLPISSS
jgi:hypothetical protein